MAKPRPKPYKIIGAYDSETCNVVDGARKAAYPVLHQLGLLDCLISQVDAGNVETVTRLYMYRHTVDLYEALERIASACVPWVPVIACHNLSFDMYGLAQFFEGRDVEVLAKSQRKPISFRVLDVEGNPRLVIWDTLVFAQKSLGYMGDECGYPKLRGDWDYDLTRTPATPLTADEKAYAAHDVYALLAWLGYWCRLNPGIDPATLALKVSTKTGVVRTRRVQRFGKLKGAGQRKTVEQWWGFINAQNAFTDDDELFTCMASTRGGFTFCARENASRVFDFDTQSGLAVYGYDATSQHPSQMVSHRYPVRFECAEPEDLERAFRVVALHTSQDVLGHFEKPFGVAFYGRFHFEGLRLKEGSVFKRYGIAPLAYARCAPYVRDPYISEENAQGEDFRAASGEMGYRDEVENPVYAFGKLESASRADLYLTELAAWEVSQAYEYDSVTAVSGYMTLSFDKPPDMAVISVMQFYAGKNAFKQAKSEFEQGRRLSGKEGLRKYGIPDFVIEGMDAGAIDQGVVDATYLGLKADLNALFGIEACNEYRRDTVLGPSGIEYEGDFGVCNAPDHPKAWYQMGQRIVGWSRIAQIIVMELAAPYIDTIVNGDTDSVKFVTDSRRVSSLNAALESYHDAVDKAKKDVCGRVRRCYPDMYDPLDGIGHYVCEFSTRQFCAAWNKAYCIRTCSKRDGLEHVRFTLAGVPSRQIDKMADALISKGWTFGQVCDAFLGYNVTYQPDVTGLVARSFPDWGSTYTGRVTDYLGHTSMVAEPSALCLYPMAKTVNDTANTENAANLSHALKNRPSVNVEPLFVGAGGIKTLKEMIAGD